MQDHMEVRPMAATWYVSLFRKKDGTYRGTKICMCFEVTGEAPFLRACFFLRCEDPKKGPFFIILVRGL